MTVRPAGPRSSRAALLVFAVVLTALVLGLRWPTFGAGLWNVDEAIHATAARTLLDGGVLYRDAIDQRTPLSYYAVAAVFAMAGENNLWAVRLAIALLIAGTGIALFVAARALRGTVAGVAAGVLYALLATGALFPGDANAANTEWFVAFFTSAAVAFLVTRRDQLAPRHFGWAGAFMGGAFLSKQPALLEAAAPLCLLIWLGVDRRFSLRRVLRSCVAYVLGWLAPVGLVAGYFALRGAWSDAVFYSWTYNLDYYGPEIGLLDRIAGAVHAAHLAAQAAPITTTLWGGGIAVTLHRLLQRQPTTSERAGNPALVLLSAWTLAACAAAAAGGRDFDHYAIPFLAPFALGAGLAWDWCLGLARRPAQNRWIRVGVIAVLLLAALNAWVVATRARSRILPEDASAQVARYIRVHSTPDDRVFVWGFQPDIYVFADRRPASRFLYGNFLTGLIPWTNVAPNRDTTYAIVPGAMEQLLEDLEQSRPRYIVDCSAGPNRHWQKYPVRQFPAFNDYLRAHYEVVEGAQFVSQGFRLLQRRAAPLDHVPADWPELAADTRQALVLGVAGTPLEPLQASAIHGAAVTMQSGRLELFAHAPSRLVYSVPPGAAGLRGGFGLREAAYATTNATPTDGAEFVITLTPAHGAPRELLRRWLRPQAVETDQGVQSLRLAFPPLPEGGALELKIDPGPSEDVAFDWTYWTDLTLEIYR